MVGATTTPKQVNLGKLPWSNPQVHTPTPGTNGSTQNSYCSDRSAGANKPSCPQAAPAT